MTNDFKPAKAGGNQPRLSKEEYAEKKRAEKEKVYQMIDDAAREIVSDPEKFKNFLDTQSRMDRYSAANALCPFGNLHIVLTPIIKIFKLCCLRILTVKDRKSTRLNSSHRN